jgi:hypothetical protein
MITPLTFFIPLGLVLVLVGTILFFVTRYKKAAKIVIGIGVAITILTFLLIVLAVNSQM